MSTPDGDIIRAVAELTLPDGTKAQNIFHFECDFTSTQSDANVVAAIATYIEDIYAEVQAYIKSTVTLDSVDVDEVQFNATKNIWEIVRSVGQGGLSDAFAGTAELLPNQVAPVLMAYTGRPKSYGRKFLTGFDESATNGSDLVSGLITAMTAALGDYLATEVISAGNDLIPVIVRATVNSVLPLVSGAVNSIVGSQRRRKPGVGA